MLPYILTSDYWIDYSQRNASATSLLKSGDSYVYLALKDALVLEPKDAKRRKLNYRDIVELVSKDTVKSTVEYSRHHLRDCSGVLTNCFFPNYGMSGHWANHHPTRILLAQNPDAITIHVTRLNWKPAEVFPAPRR